MRRAKTSRSNSSRRPTSNTSSSWSGPARIDDEPVSLLPRSAKPGTGPRRESWGLPRSGFRFPRPGDRPRGVRPEMVRAILLGGTSRDLTATVGNLRGYPGRALFGFRRVGRVFEAHRRGVIADFHGRKPTLTWTKVRTYNLPVIKSHGEIVHPWDR